jgi:hypothetical protein
MQGDEEEAGNVQRGQLIYQVTRVSLGLWLQRFIYDINFTGQTSLACRFVLLKYFMNNSRRHFINK